MNGLRTGRWRGSVVAWLVLSAVVSAAESSPPLKLRWQDADDEVVPLIPRQPRTAAMQNKLEAVAWYGTGRLLEARNELQGALKAYRKAVEIDPEAIDIYRALVPLALRLDQVEEAIKLAVKAVELDPEDYELLLRIGVQFARQRDFDAGVKHLEQALKSKRLEKESPTFVMLNIELGMLYQVVGKPESAAECYAVIFDALQHPDKYELDFRTKTALLADPRTSYERIGQVLMEGKRLDLASEAFELAAKSGRSGAGNLSYNRAKILLLSDKAEAALDELQKYFDAQRQSKGRDAYQLLADILKKLNRGDELVGRLEKLAEQDPRNNQLQYFFADKLVEAGELERARQIYETALKGGGDAAGYLGLAGVLRRMKRADELLDVLGRGLAKTGPEGLENLDIELQAVSADAALVDALVAAARAQAKADPVQLNFEEAYLLAKVVAELKRLDEAAEFFKLAATYDKDRGPLALRDLAELLMDNKRFADAADVYDDALKARVQGELKARLYLGLIQSREFAGQTPAALEACAEARKQFPTVPLFEFQEAWVYYHARQFEEAVPRFEKIMEAHADQVRLVRQCQFSLSNIHVLKGELRKGEEILEKVLEEDPEDPAVNNDLGYLYADQGKHLEKAEQMIRKAIAAEPENAAYLDSLGWVYFKLGKLAEAVEPLEKAVSKSTGGDATIWDHLGDVYQRLNKVDKAVDAWTKALKDAEGERHPDAKLIERLKAKLQENRGKAEAPKPAQPKSP